MVKERYTNIICLLISCTYKHTTTNGNSVYSIIVLMRDIVSKRYKVIHGTSQDYSCYGLSNKKVNCYTPAKIYADFYVTDKNKAVFTELKEI